MATEWSITTAAERFTLDAQNRGEITFTVTNPSARPDRAVVEPVPGDNAVRSWFAVAEPLRFVPAGGSVVYLMTTTVPAGTAAGRYSVQARVYSADTAPEETSRLSNRVVFDVGPVRPPPPKRQWWPYAVAAGLVVVVLTVVGWLVLRPDGSGKADTGPSTPLSTTTNPTPPPPNQPGTPIRTGQAIGIFQDVGADLDHNRSFASGSDLIYIRATTPERVVASSAARLAYLGVVAPSYKVCAEARLGTEPVRTASLAKDGVLCVLTTDGNLAVTRFRELKRWSTPGFGGSSYVSLVLDYDLYTHLSRTPGGGP